MKQIYIKGGAFKTMPASPKSTKSMSDSEYNAVKSQIKLEEDQQPFGNKSSPSSIFTFPTDQAQFNALQQQQQQHCEAMALEQQRCNQQQQLANENFLSQCNMLSKGKIVAIHLNNHQTSNHHQIDNHELITTSVSNTNSTNSTTTTITSTNFDNNNANNNIINKTTTNNTADVVQQQQSSSSIVYETIIVENNNNHHLNDHTSSTTSLMTTTGKLSSSTAGGGIVVLTNASLSELLNSGNDATAKEKLTIINDSSKKSMSQSILMINSGSLNTAVSSSGSISASGTPIMATNQLTGQKQLMFLNNNQVRRTNIFPYCWNRRSLTQT